MRRAGLATDDGGGPPFRSVGATTPARISTQVERGSYSPAGSGPPGRLTLLALRSAPLPQTGSQLEPVACRMRWDGWRIGGRWGVGDKVFGGWLRQSLSTHFRTVVSRLKSNSSSVNLLMVETMIPPKRLLVDGNLSGYVPASETMEQQVDAAFASVKAMRGEVVQVEIKMFRQALSFARTSSMLYNSGLKRPPRDFLVVAPFVVNTAFALELYLKTLGRQYGAVLHGHDLCALFSELPVGAKDVIAKHLQDVSEAGHVSSLQCLHDVLQKGRSAFVGWRYLYEDNFNSEIPIQPLISAVEILDQSCRASFPEGTFK